jgi:glycosyltransferase involved in cell wall biosynthesis
MKIFYLITKSEEGGAQTHVAQLVGYFTGKGHEVAVMSYPGGWLEGEVKKAGAVFFPNPYFANSYNPLRSLKAILEIGIAVRNFKPDLVHCHSSIAGFLGRLAVRNKVPTIFTAHGWGFNDYVGPVSRFAAAAAEKMAAYYTAKIICVSEFTKNLALKHKIAPAGKFVVVHNGIEKFALSEIALRNQAARSLQNGKIPEKFYAPQEFLTGYTPEKKAKVAGEKLKIVFVGRFAEPKEPEILVRAYTSLDESVKNKAELLIVGEGPKREALLKLIAADTGGAIKLLGRLSRSEVLKILAEADISVLASKWESFGLSALEAMSASVPVVVSRVGGLPELVDESCGILVEKSDEKGMKEALEKLIQNRELRKKLGETARLRAEIMFSLDKMLAKTEEVYRAILKDKSYVTC